MRSASCCIYAIRSVVAIISLFFGTVFTSSLIINETVSFFNCGDILFFYLIQIVGFTLLLLSMFEPHRYIRIGGVLLSSTGFIGSFVRSFQNSCESNMLTIQLITYQLLTVLNFVTLVFLCGVYAASLFSQYTEIDETSDSEV